MEKLKKLLDQYGFLLVLVLSVPAIKALIIPGFFGASDDVHIAYLFEMDRVIKLGQIPPRFVPDLSFGFGYPLFNFIYPLPFYIGEIFHKLSFSLVDSIKLVFGASLSFSALSMYLLLKEFTSSELSILGSIIYLYTPYRANDVYNRGDIGESLSFVFLPLVALAVAKLSSRMKINFRWVGLGAVVLSLLVLSHDIAAYMFIPPAILLGLILFFVQKSGKSFFINFLLMLTLGLLICIYFWLPILIDSPLMKHDTVFNFISNFPHLNELITPYWGYGASDPNSNSSMSFFIGSANLIAVLLGSIFTFIFWKKYSPKQQGILIWSMVLFVVAFAMMNIRSSLIWSSVPLLPYFQFPWRFLILTTFVTPLFVITLEKVSFKGLFKLLPLILTGVIVIFSVFMFKPHDFLGRSDAYYVSRYIPVPAPSKDYYQTNESYLLTKATQIRPNSVYPPAYGMGILNTISYNPLSTQVLVSSQNGTSINFNKYNFPGWEAYLDGRSVDIISGEPFGQIDVQAPAGMHTILVKFNETPTNKMLDVLSVLALFGAIGMIIFI